MKKPLKNRLLALLFPLPFVAVGIGLLLFSVMPDLYQWQQMKAWPQVEAELLHAELLINRGEDSDTYRAVARYKYRYQAQDYTGERVAIMGGSDNIGDFQQDLARQLERAHRSGQPVSAWVNPDNPSDAVLNRDLRWNLLGFKMIFALVFGGVGIGLMVLAFKAKAGPTEHPERATKPWLGQQEWASPVIRCNGKSNFWGIWFIAIIWNLISLPASLAIPEEWAEGNKLIPIALIFPIGGIYLLFWAIKSTLGWRRFGQLHLTLDPYPGILGGQVGGTLEVPVSFNSQQRFPVTLQCVHSYETGSGKSRNRKEKVLWQASGLAHTHPSPTNGTLLAIAFDVPANLPASETHSQNYRFWRLDLSADLPGVDLQRQFELPVFASVEKSRSNLPLSTQHPQLSDEHQALIESVANIEQIPGGVAMYFPMLHSWGNNLVGLVCGLFFFGAGLLMRAESDAPAVIVWTFTLMGGGIAFICLKWLFTSLRVRLDQSGLISERFWLGIPIGRDQIPQADIAGLQITLGVSGNGAKGFQELYKIHALTHKGKKILVAMNLQGRATAEAALEAIAGLSGYGIK